MFDINEYKKAKILKPELETIIQIFALTLRALSFYTKFTKVNETISVLYTNKKFLELHLKKANGIIESKGEVKTT